MSQLRKKKEETATKKPEGGFTLPTLTPPSAHDLIAAIDEELEYGGDGGDECLCF